MSTNKFLSLRRLFIFIILGLFSVLLQAQETGVIIKEKISISPKVSTPNIINNKTFTIPDDLIRSYTLKYPARIRAGGRGGSFGVLWGEATIDPMTGDSLYPCIYPITCNGVLIRFNSRLTFDDSGSCKGGYYDIPFEGISYGIFPSGTALTFDWYHELFTTPPYDGIFGYLERECYIARDSIGETGDCNADLALYGKYYVEDKERYYDNGCAISIDRVDFCPPISIFKDSSTTSNILQYGESREITIGLIDACGRHTSDIAPTPVNYHVAITGGNEFGYLYNQATEECGDSISVSAEDCYANFMFSATEQQPTEDQQIGLRVWSDDASYIPYSTTFIVQSASCMNLSVSKPQIIPGETVSININSSYPPDQIYSIQMNTGEGYGKLRCVETGEEGTSISGIQPFEFIAADSIAGDSVVIEIEANVTPGGVIIGSVRSGPVPLGKDTFPEETNSLSETVKASIQPVMGKQQQKRQSLLMNMNQMTMAASVEEGCEAIAKVTIKEECTDPINECSPEQLQPQTFDPSSNIKVYSEGETFKGEDATGYPFSTIITGCYYNPEKRSDVNDWGGVTRPMRSIPFEHERGRPYYVPLTQNSLSLSVCLEPSTGRWIPHVNNLSIPIFMSFCNNSNKEVFNYVNEASLDSQIPDEDTYDQIIEDLKQWKRGPNSLISRKLGFNVKYVFPIGIWSHEDYHLFEHGKVFESRFNQELLKIYQIQKTRQNVPCPSDAIKEFKVDISPSLMSAWGDVLDSRNNSYYPGCPEDKDADINAGFTYQHIYDQIHAWGTKKGWN
jgi:hypothetical protein